jgi:hypothetical protein
MPAIAGAAQIAPDLSLTNSTTSCISALAPGRRHDRRQHHAGASSAARAGPRQERATIGRPLFRLSTRMAETYVTPRARFLIGVGGIDTGRRTDEIAPAPA